jgi:hypothetical protein
MFNFRFGLKRIDCSNDTKSVRRAPFDRLNDSLCFPVKSVQIFALLNSDDVPANRYANKRSSSVTCLSQAMKRQEESKARPVHRKVTCLLILLSE